VSWNDKISYFLKYYLYFVLILVNNAKDFCMLSGGRPVLGFSE